METLQKAPVIIEVKQGQLRAWRYDEPGDPWRIVKDFQVVAEVHAVTTRQKKDSWRNKSGWRIATQTTAKVTVRLAYQVEHTLRDDIIGKGEKETIRQIMKLADEGYIYHMASYDLEAECRKAGKSELDIMNAYYTWNERRNNMQDQATRFYRLLKGVK